MVTYLYAIITRWGIINKNCMPNASGCIQPCSTAFVQEGIRKVPIILDQKWILQLQHYLYGFSCIYKFYHACQMIITTDRIKCFRKSQVETQILFFPSSCQTVMVMIRSIAPSYKSPIFSTCLFM